MLTAKMDPTGQLAPNSNFTCHSCQNASLSAAFCQAQRHTDDAGKQSTRYAGKMHACAASSVDRYRECNR